MTNKFAFHTRTSADARSEHRQHWSVPGAILTGTVHIRAATLWPLITRLKVSWMSNLVCQRAAEKDLSEAAPIKLDLSRLTCSWLTLHKSNGKKNYDIMRGAFQGKSCTFKKYGYWLWPSWQRVRPGVQTTLASKSSVNSSIKLLERQKVILLFP